jgi:FkbM family methyltransferase
MVRVMGLLKRIITRLPAWLQHEIRIWYYRCNIIRGKFVSEEFEYPVITQFIGKGDWVIDVGANVGHYTCLMSKLVGIEGRVLSFEPVPDTFRFLVANGKYFPHDNVSFINAAVSDESGEPAIDIPRDANGINYYQAHVTNGVSAGIHVLSLSIDSLSPAKHISFIKIDAEGHDYKVLLGLRKLIIRDKPTLMVEANASGITEYLENLGYLPVNLPGSHNTIYIQKQNTDLLKSLQKSFGTEN